MMRRVSMVFVVIFCMAISGCAAMRNFDGSLDKDIKKLKQDNEACQSTLQDREGELDQLNKQVSSLSREVETLKSEMQQTKGAMQKDLVKAAGGDQSLEEKRGELSGSGHKGVRQDQKSDAEKKADTQTEAVVQGIESKALKLKVLSGNGKISSAKSMSERLNQMGYRVESTGLASRSNFPVITVYYAPDYRNEAQHLAVQLSRGAISAPLTWPSTFHVIVVTGP
jgi:hypothetical protein